MDHVADLMPRQYALEEEMRSLGIEAYRDRARKADERGQSSERTPVRRLIGAAHDRIVAAIGAFRAEANSGRAGRKHNAITMMDTVEDDDLLAHLTLRCVMDDIGGRPTLTQVSLMLARLVEDELFYRAFKEQIPTAYSATLRKLEDKTSASYKRASTRITGKKLGVEFDGWDRRTQLLIGSKLIELLVEVTGLVELKRISDGGKTPYVLCATQETLAYLETEDGRTEWLAPLYMPCLVPPKPWTTPFNGGYHSGRVRRLTLVKTPNKAYLHELAEQDMPQVYSAINALQETGWAINTRVLEVMDALWIARSDMQVIPQADPAPTPQKPGWLTPEMK